MIYLLLSYVIGQIFYHHLYTACFLFLTLTCSMVFKKYPIPFYILIVFVSILGYNVESYMLKEYNSQQHPQINSPSPISIKMNIDFNSLPLIKNNQYTANITSNHNHFILSSYNLKRMYRPNASFILNYSCTVEGKIKPSSIKGAPAYFTIKTLKTAQCFKRKPNLMNRIEYYKNIATERIMNSNIHGKRTIIALITGQTQFLDHNYREIIRSLGISHLYAISGTHVGIFTFLLNNLLKRMPIPRFIVKLTLLIILPVFLIFTGYSPSAERAVFMTMLGLVFSKWLHIASLHLLLVTYLLLSFFEPQLHYHIGFQFSFTICFLLIFLQKCYIHLSFIKVLFITSFLSTIGTLAISYHHLNEFQWLGLITNVFFIPLYCTLILPFAFCTVLFSVMAPQLLFLFEVPFYILFHLEQCLIFIFNPMTAIHFFIPHAGEVGYFIFVVFMFILMLLCKYNRYFLALSMMFVLIYMSSIFMTHHVNRMTVIDVGQGDSILFESQNGKKLMIDTGGKNERLKAFNSTYNISEKRILPLFKKRGIRTIDYLVLTHDHQDHIGELKHLVDAIKIKQIIINPNKFDKEKLKTIIQLSNERDIKVQSYLNQHQIQLGEFTFKFYNTDIQNSDDPNEHSIVTLASFNNIDTLLMGDATELNEKQLLSKYSLPTIELLKVGHHGSKTSSSENFLRTIHPKVALISSGQNNIYHLPHPEIIKRLNSLDIKTYNTSKNSHISIIFQDNHYFITNEK